MTLTLTNVMLAKAGDTIIVFEGEDEEGTSYRFGVDHRPAMLLLNALASEVDVQVEVEPWQIISTSN